MHCCQPLAVIFQYLRILEQRTLVPLKFKSWFCPGFSGYKLKKDCHKHVFCYLKTYVKISVGEKVCKNTCNVV